MAESHESQEETVSNRKRSYPSNDDVGPTDSKRGPYKKEPLLKLLVPNDAAGALIGKGGSNLNELKSKYGASVRISHSRELYPSTGERIVILTGEVTQIIDLHNYIMDKVAEAKGINRVKDDHRGHQVKMILPNETAGLVIGKGGAKIKALKEETGASLMFTGRDESPVSGERILTIRGNTEQRIEASRQLIGKIASDEDNMANTSLKYSHRARDNTSNDFNEPQRPHENRINESASSHGNMNNLSNLAEVAQQLVGLAQGHSQGQSGLANIENDIKTTVQIQMEVPELLVAPISGIQGSALREFSVFSGARLEFSRSDLNSHRSLTIQGNLNEAQIGYHLVSQKITQICNELKSAGLQRL